LWRVGTHRPDDTIERAQRIVVDGEVIEADWSLCAVRRRTVPAALIAAAENSDDVARWESHRRTRDVEAPLSVPPMAQA
jgi:hypothetical protein